MKKTVKSKKRVIVSTLTAESLIRVFLTSVIHYHHRFENATKEIYRFLQHEGLGHEASTEEVIMSLADPIGSINFAKHLIIMESLLKRSKIDISEKDMQVVKPCLQMYKEFLTDKWPEHKTHLEKLLKQAYKDYRSQRSSDNQS